ncbi:MAG: hypothetical protein HQK49_21965 [Oligoflexia bacterium]|nr:hypothetical protein [Oligoflexia bacterium]
MKVVVLLNDIKFIYKHMPFLFSIVLNFFFLLMFLHVIHLNIYASTEKDSGWRNQNQNLFSFKRDLRKKLKKNSDTITALEYILNDLIKKDEKLSIPLTTDNEVQIIKIAGCFLYSNIKYVDRLSLTDLKNKNILIESEEEKITFNSKFVIFFNQAQNSKTPVNLKKLIERYYKECKKHNELIDELLEVKKNIATKYIANKKGVSVGEGLMTFLDYLKNNGINMLFKCIGCNKSCSVNGFDQEDLNRSDIQLIQKTVTRWEEEKEFNKMVVYFEKINLEQLRPGNNKEDIELEKIIRRFLEILNHNSSLMEKLEISVLMDLLKYMLATKSSSNIQIHENFLKKNFEQISIMLERESFKENEFITSFYLNNKNKKLNRSQQESLFYFLKQENDILQLIAMRSNVAGNLMRNIVDSMNDKNLSDSELLEKKKLVEKEKMGQEFLSKMAKQSYIRVIIGLKVFENLVINNKKIEDVLMKLIHPPKDKDGRYKKINRNWDLEYYGRWGAIGEKVEGIVKLEKNRETDSESNEIRNNHEQIYKKFINNVKITEIANATEMGSIFKSSGFSW